MKHVAIEHLDSIKFWVDAERGLCIASARKDHEAGRTESANEELARAAVYLSVSKRIEAIMNRKRTS